MTAHKVVILYMSMAIGTNYNVLENIYIQAFPSLRLISPHFNLFKGVYGMVQILLPLQVDLGTICHSLHVHVFTLAGLCLLL